MLWNDFVHLTQMEFFLKYWYLYLIFIVVWILSMCLWYKVKKSDMKEWKELFKDKYK